MASAEEDLVEEVVVDVAADPAMDGVRQAPRMEVEAVGDTHREATVEGLPVPEEMVGEVPEGGMTAGAMMEDALVTQADRIVSLSFICRILQDLCSVTK